MKTLPQAYKKASPRGVLFLSIISISFLLYTSIGVSLVNAETSVETEKSNFYAVWRLLSADQKKDFVAGYLQGWKDASKVTDIAINYVKENPGSAISDLERLKEVYDLGQVSPQEVATQVDTFFSGPENRSKPLSLAISVACQKVR